jgi:hypothetical protein
MAAESCLAVTFPKQIGTSTALSMTPSVMLGMLGQRLVSRSLRNFTQTNYKRPNAPTNLFWMKWPPFPIIPNRASRSWLLTGIPGPTQMVATISKKANKLLGQVSTTPVQATLTSQVFGLEQGAASHPPDPHEFPFFLWVGETHGTRHCDSSQQLCACFNHVQE